MDVPSGTYDGFLAAGSTSYLDELWLVAGCVLVGD